MEKSKKFYEILVSAIFVVASIYFLIDAYNTKSPSTPGMMGAMTFPKILLYCILALSSYTLVKSLYTGKETMALKEKFERTDVRIWITMVLSIVYMAFWRYISFSIGTWLYIAFEAKILDKSIPLKKSLLISFFITLVIFLVFRIVFSVALSENLLNSFGIYF